MNNIQIKGKKIIFFSLVLIIIFLLILYIGSDASFDYEINSNYSLLLNKENFFGKCRKRRVKPKNDRCKLSRDDNIDDDDDDEAIDSCDEYKNCARKPLNTIKKAIDNIKKNTDIVNRIGKSQVEQANDAIDTIKAFQDGLDGNYRDLANSINSALRPLDGGSRPRPRPRPRPGGRRRPSCRQTCAMCNKCGGNMGSGNNSPSTEDPTENNQYPPRNNQNNRNNRNNPNNPNNSNNNQNNPKNIPNMINDYADELDDMDDMDNYDNFDSDNSYNPCIN